MTETYNKDIDAWVEHITRISNLVTANLSNTSNYLTREERVQIESLFVAAFDSYIDVLSDKRITRASTREPIFTNYQDTFEYIENRFSKLNLRKAYHDVRVNKDNHKGIFKKHIAYDDIYDGVKELYEL